MSTIQELRAAGWRFEYEPATQFVGANHSDGGKFSLCELKASLATFKSGGEP